MVRGFYAQIVDKLKQHGYSFKRYGKGDHEIWFSPTSGVTVSVDRGCLSRHTANKAMKDAGIDHKF